MPGTSGALVRALAARDAPDDAQRVLVVVVRARGSTWSTMRHGRHDERRQQRVAEGVDVAEARAAASSASTSASASTHEHEQEAEHERERQPQRRHQRRQHRVEHRDQRGDHERGAGLARARRRARAAAATQTDAAATTTPPGAAAAGSAARRVPSPRGTGRDRVHAVSGAGPPAGGEARSAACSSFALARDRSAEMRAMADVIGAARIRPTAPKSAPPPIVTIRTASG